MILHYFLLFFFFFNDTATTEIYTLSLHDALPISSLYRVLRICPPGLLVPDDSHSVWTENRGLGQGDRKSTRLNSSHTVISYAVFCLKKKNTKIENIRDDQTEESSIVSVVRCDVRS